MIKNKFYVGAPYLAYDSDNYCKATLQAAINEAKIKCEDSGDDQIVVKIVAIVKQSKIPVQVRMVK